MSTKTVSSSVSTQFGLRKIVPSLPVTVGKAAGSGTGSLFGGYVGREIVMVCVWSPF